LSLQRQTNFSVSSSRVPIRNIADYSPFGVQLDGRAIQGDFYRYGFQNQEKDDEISGNGNSYSAEFWQYDSRAGRRWNLDPVFKEHESPYACFANNPICFADPNGADTINGNKAIPAIKDLKKWAGQLDKQKSNIEEMIKNRDKIYESIGDIDTKQEYSELMNDINPFKKNPWHKAVDKNIKINEHSITALKVGFVAMELIINAEIYNYNSSVENYNSALAELNFAFKTMDDDDNLYISNEKGTVYMSQNSTNKKAALRLTIDDDIYRFGFISSNQKGLMKTLNSQEKMGYIMPSLDLLGANAGDIIKAHPKVKEIHSKMTKDIQKGLNRELKKL
jgi:RHS repeat-associated protein